MPEGRRAVRNRMTVTVHDPCQILSLPLDEYQPPNIAMPFCEIIFKLRKYCTVGLFSWCCRWRSGVVVGDHGAVTAKNDCIGIKLLKTRKSSRSLQINVIPDTKSNSSCDTLFDRNKRGHNVKRVALQINGNGIVVPHYAMYTVRQSVCLHIPGLKPQKFKCNCKPKQYFNK